MCASECPAATPERGPRGCSAAGDIMGAPVPETMLLRMLKPPQKPIPQVPDEGYEVFGSATYRG